MTMIRTALTASVLLAACSLGSASLARATDNVPTCADLEFLDIDVHGQHVVRDYVAGLGHDGSDWPLRGGAVGKAVSANGGAAVPGGPGPGFHFPNGVAPGASFCTDSNSDGLHLGE